jgi:hypothetical protein
VTTLDVLMLNRNNPGHTGAERQLAYVVKRHEQSSS